MTRLVLGSPLTSQSLNKQKLLYCNQLYANKVDNLKETGKSSERYNLLRLNQEELENMNRPVTRTEIETDWNTKVQDKQIHSQILSNKQRRVNTYPSETIPGKSQRKEHCHTHSVRLPWPRYQNQIRIPQKGKITHQYHWWTHAKILNKMLTNQIQQYSKRIIHHGQVGFIPGM